MGQSLAGAISTSTHGTDFEIASLASMVRAIHLVGPGAEEYWLERRGAPVTTDRSLRENLPDWVNTINVIREDAPFLAALVSVGRCGVVYSYIIEVEPAFQLEELRSKHLWSTVRSELTNAAGRPNAAGWIQHMRSKFGKAPSFRGDPAPGPMRAFDVALNPEDRQTAWTTARWKSARGNENKFLSEKNVGAGPDYKKDGRDADGARFAAHFDVHGSFALLARVVFDCRVKEEQRRGRNYQITCGRPQPTYRTYSTMYQHFDLFAPRARFLEVFFDAMDTNYIAYVDRLLNLYSAQRSGAQAGYIAIRFTAKSDAPLAMQEWPLTACVELAFLEGFSGTDYGLNRGILEAAPRDARFHWGMLQNKADDSNARPRGNLRAWREGAERLGITRRNDIFSTKFTQEYGLEV